MSIDAESFPPPGNSPAVARRYAHDWALFADWCSACDYRMLPAHPATVAEFLADHPAAHSTQRRRITAINTVHAANGHQSPGRSETIRQMLGAARAERLARVAAVAWQRIPRIPVTGWPGGLFGRRDALILALVAVGLSFEQIARLRRADVAIDAEALVIGVEGQWIRVAASSTGDVSAVEVYRNWVEILGFLDRYPSARLLAGRLDTKADLSAFAKSARHDTRPLLSPIDRWGHTPLAPTALSGQSVATIARAHLNGQAPNHKRPSTRRRTVPAQAESATGPGVVDIELDQGYYDRGIHARRDAHTHLEDVSDILDGIEDEADRLLADLLAILDTPELET
ncbi:MAG: hypothetical protein WAW17_32740 [Rhodococcus sp. (in: high G+C Gram-positive bacteria)]|uniref:hypothetical protein n=1 Tax=Rhodococcus sp. TaxID=1831 RepID=UPI003BB11646